MFYLSRMVSSSQQLYVIDIVPPLCVTDIVVRLEIWGPVSKCGHVMTSGFEHRWSTLKTCVLNNYANLRHKCIINTYFHSCVFFWLMVFSWFICFRRFLYQIMITIRINTYWTLTMCQALLYRVRYYYYYFFTSKETGHCRSKVTLLDAG